MAGRHPLEQRLPHDSVGEQLGRHHFTRVIAARPSPESPVPVIQSLNGSNSFSPAITTMTGLNVSRTSIVSP